jgi:hypothetical protein
MSSASRAARRKSSFVCGLVYDGVGVFGTTLPENIAQIRTGKL